MIHTQFDQALQKLGNGAAATITIDDAPRELTCDIVERNALALTINQLRLATTELAASSPADLERIGQALAGRLTYLMEPIAPIEHDREGCVVQLRSNPPQRGDDGRSYYELLVRRGGHITLTRYHKENTSPRRQIRATLTREVLLRLVGDFSAVLS
jgi:hypothetical protein